MKKWKPGVAPISVLMITLNEAHNLNKVLDNLEGWADEVIIVDSYSKDATVDIALERGVNIVQRRFDDFGSQWNFALSLPVRNKWTMKLDPDEILTDELKNNIIKELSYRGDAAFSLERALMFFGKVLPICQDVLRIWPTGKCKFSNVKINEHPLVDLPVNKITGRLEHHDSPNLHHWFNKQNLYSTFEAHSKFEGSALSVEPKILGNSLERRMWLKKNFWKFPFKFLIIFLYHYFYLGTWRCGKVGFYWSQLRTFVYWQWYLKYYEMLSNKSRYQIIPEGVGEPDKRVKQF